MSLADFKPARAEIFFPGGSFQVRGLGVSDIGTLCRLHLDQMETIAEAARANAGLMQDPVLLQQFGFDIVGKVPAVVATIIAISADELELAEAALKLPLVTQFAALRAIAELTFQDMAGLDFILTTGKTLLGLALPPVDPAPIDNEGHLSSGGIGHTEAPRVYS